jgi:hypothetical protein
VPVSGIAVYLPKCFNSLTYEVQAVPRSGIVILLTGAENIGPARIARTFFAIYASVHEVARNSVESKRRSELIDYATATPFAIGFLETAFAIAGNSIGI